MRWVFQAVPRYIIFLRISSDSGWNSSATGSILYRDSGSGLKFPSGRRHGIAHNVTVHRFCEPGQLRPC